MRRSHPLLLLVFAVAAALTVGCRAETTPKPTLCDEFKSLCCMGKQSCPLGAKPEKTSEVGNVKIERVKFTPEPGFDAVALIYRPKAEGKYPAVVVQHWLGGSKDNVIFDGILNTLAQRGYVAAAIDGRYRGERQNGKSLEVAMLEALRTGKGHPFLLDTAYDDMRLIDYLETRPDVDKDRIGMTGLSEGGIETWMVTAMDPRVKVAVPVIGVTTFGDALKSADSPDADARALQFKDVLESYAKDIGEPKVNGRVLARAWDKLVPGMLDRFDAPNLIAQIAPRPLLILSHEKDELFPVEGAKKVAEVVRARYKELGVEDKFDFKIAPGLKHASFNFTEPVAMAAWFDRWLKPAEAKPAAN